MAYSYNSAPQDRDTHNSHQELFRQIEFKESRHRSLWMSIAVHSVSLSVLLLIPPIFTDAIKLKYDAVLIAPPPPRPKPVLEVTPYRQPAPKPRLEKPLVIYDDSAGY